jgi:hypothetical protein
MDWTDKDAVREYHRKYYHEKRRKPMLDYLGGQCVRCGSTEELQFDHIRREDKSFNISTKMTLSDPEVRAELDKCQLLCKDCHQRKTGAEMEGFTHGTLYAWMKKGCRCEVCEPEWRSWNDERNAKRRKPGGYGPRGGVAER